MLKRSLFYLLASILFTGGILFGKNSINTNSNYDSPDSTCNTDKNKNINNNKMEKVEMNFESKRVTRNYRQTINATPEVIFPLICPVKEAEWLDDWDYKMIYSISGVAELGAVFTTSFWEDTEQIWIITKHDPIKNEVEFARVVPGLVTSVLDVNILPKDEQSSYVDITYTYTSLTEKGNNFIDNKYTEEFFVENMKEWEDSMNYFLQTGTVLKSSH